MEKIFRLYNKINSSYFNLIDGSLETKQTKGLGLLLSRSALTLDAFFCILKNRNPDILIPELSTAGLRMIVDCELESVNRDMRIDILIRFYIEKKPLIAFIIEVKSASSSTSVNIASKQLTEYMGSCNFLEIVDFKEKIYAVTLTKYAEYIHDNDFISITWMDIIEEFNKKISLSKNKNSDQLLKDYFVFITNINNGMKFYEKEVYSIPVKESTLTAIEDVDCRIYECPNESQYILKHQPLFFAFREPRGGLMKNLYKIDEIIIFDFEKDYDLFMNDDKYSIKMKDRIKKYINIRDLPRGQKQVFFLSEVTIPLPPNLKPKKNNSYRAYYELIDLFNNNI